MYCGKTSAWREERRCAYTYTGVCREAGRVPFARRWRTTVRGTEEEHAMPALETKDTQAPRSALRHRPLGKAGTPGPAPLYRRASRVQGSVATQPPQTGAPVKSARNRRRL